VLALGLGACVYGLSQGPVEGWTDAGVIWPIVAGFALLAVFCVIETRTRHPLVEFRLLRRLNFVAANISQFVAGMVELGLGYLLPYFMLLVVGASRSSPASR
jgi:hypothetical protein